MAPTNLKRVEEVEEVEEAEQPKFVEELPQPKFGDASQIEIMAMLQDENVHLRAHARRLEVYNAELVKRVEELKTSKKK